MRKFFLATLFVAAFFLTGCSLQTSSYETIYNDELANYVQSQYPLFDVVASSVDSSNYSEIYEVDGKSLDAVASELEGIKKPIQVSDKNNNKQVLVYDQMFAILSVSEDNPENTLIEIANKEFVRNNFNPGFFEGMLLMTFLDDVLDVDDWGKNRRNRCQTNPSQCYGGYSSSGGSFKGYSNSPTVRGGTSTIRGGGPGMGK